MKKGQTWETKAGGVVHVIHVSGERATVCDKERLSDADSFTFLVRCADGQAQMRDNDWDLKRQMPRVYVAGPMTGIADLNFPAFNAAAAELRKRGAWVENPAEINPDPSMSWDDAMRADIPRLLTCDTIYMLPGWEKSRGACLEHHIAEALGMTITYE